MIKYILEYHCKHWNGVRRFKYTPYNMEGTHLGAFDFIKPEEATKMTRSDALHLAAILTTMEERSGLSAEARGTYVVAEAEVR